VFVRNKDESRQAKSRVVTTLNLIVKRSFYEIKTGIKVKKCCCISKNIRESVCKYFILLYCPTHIIKPV
jgi:hypothetical protein